MSNFVRVYNGTPVPYSLSQLKLDLAPTSIPSGYLPDDFLRQYNVYRVKQTPPPECGELQVAIPNEIPELSSEGWEVTWTVIDLPETEAEEVVRKKRNAFLEETDWTALSDNTLTPEMASYRQALRDITDQAGFPYEVDWPEKP